MTKVQMMIRLIDFEALMISAVGMILVWTNESGNDIDSNPTAILKLWLLWILP
jgi:hypothetical protein